MVLSMPELTRQGRHIHDAENRGGDGVVKGKDGDGVHMTQSRC